MLGWLVAMGLVAILAGLLGFIILAGVLAFVARILFLVVLALLVIGAVSALMQRGRRLSPRRWEIKNPPQNVDWRVIRPRAGQESVRAWRAEENSSVQTRVGALQARAGLDYIVEYEGGARAVVRGDIFERSYEPLGDGRFQKRRDVQMRAFTLDRPALVHTLEGPQEAEPGDWVIEGVVGEIWPVPRAAAVKKYESARERVMAKD
ncbi:MAG TPA: hypothetical protein PKY87_03065 [Terricaulis sp.]|nr:hypothetical protein [Terricaulis sp.]